VKYTTLILLLILTASFTFVQATELTGEHLQIRFTDSGAVISATACFPDCQLAGSQTTEYAGTEPLISFPGPEKGWRRERRDNADHTEMRFIHDEMGLTRSYSLSHEGYSLLLKLAGDNGTMVVQSGPGLQPPDAPGFGKLLEQLRYQYFSDSDGIFRMGLDETPDDRPPVAEEGWFGFRNRYWSMMLSADVPVQPEFAAGPDIVNGALELKDLPPEIVLKMYIGPVEPAALAAAVPQLRDTMFAGLWFWLRWICFGLYALLGWIATVIPNWGLAIIALSLVVKVLMIPLNKIADHFQGQVNEVQAKLEPRLYKIKKQFKGAEQSEKILALHKEFGVTPLYSLKSLFGVMVLIPVFIGAFDMLAENIYLAGTGFLWISDLARPDAVFRLPFTLPFFGGYLNLLPFLMTGLSVATSYLHNPPALTPEMHKRQYRNLVIMAIAFFLLFYTFPAGMVLYWTTNNLISVIKDLWGLRQDSAVSQQD
jgi:YidC/Oxa1 family membrane protein insertase